MSLVYLANGQMSYLKEQIGNKYIVNKIFTMNDDDCNPYDHNGDYYWGTEIVDPNDTIVDKIFLKPPVAKLDKTIKDLQAQKKQIKQEIEQINADKNRILKEMDSIAKTKIDAENFIIDRSDLLNAKKIVVFRENTIDPLIFNKSDKKRQGFRLQLSIDVVNGEEESWYYILAHDDWGASYRICKKYGYLINPTQEEIDETARQRVKELQFRDWDIERADDKYLTADLRKRKRDLISSRCERDIETLLREIQEKKSSIDRLKSKINQVKSK